MLRTHNSPVVITMAMPMCMRTGLWDAFGGSGI